MLLFSFSLNFFFFSYFSVTPAGTFKCLVFEHFCFAVLCRLHNSDDDGDSNANDDNDNYSNDKIPLKVSFLRDAHSLQEIPGCGEWPKVGGSMIGWVI